MGVIRLERLPSNIPIADKASGKPMTAFTRWWDQALTQIEDNLNAVIVAQEAADAAQSTADSAQAAADAAAAAAATAAAAAAAAQTAANTAQAAADAAAAHANALDASLDVSTGKLLTVLNSMTLSGIDGSTLNIGAGGTLGSNAFTSAGSDTAYAWRSNNLSDLTNTTAARANLGLSNVENKSSATIRSEITSSNVTTALGYTPLNPASNLSDVASVATARSNLGVTATGADTTYCYRSNNLSDVTAATARTNLGLGTAATQNTGTSGATVPLLNGANTFSGTTIFNPGPVYINTTAPFATEKLSVVQSASAYCGYFGNSNAGGSSMMVRFQYSAATPNNNSSYFLFCDDATASRFYVFTNGGIANYTGNNSALSDAALKTDIARYSDADLDALETAFKAVDWCRFKYIDQTHDDWNHGYTAQGVEAAFAGVAPELAEDIDLGPKATDGTPQKHKIVYDADLTHIGHALLARALSRIAALEGRP